MCTLRHIDTSGTQLCKVYSISDKAIGEDRTCRELCLELIIESFRLDKTFKITESNCKSNAARSH